MRAISRADERSGTLRERFDGSSLEPMAASDREEHMMTGSSTETPGRTAAMDRAKLAGVELEYRVLAGSGEPVLSIPPGPSRMGSCRSSPRRPWPIATA